MRMAIPVVLIAGFATAIHFYVGWLDHQPDTDLALAVSAAVAGPEAGTGVSPRVLRALSEAGYTCRKSPAAARPRPDGAPARVPTVCRFGSTGSEPSDGTLVLTAVGEGRVLVEVLRTE